MDWVKNKKIVAGVVIVVCVVIIILFAVSSNDSPAEGAKKEIAKEKRINNADKKARTVSDEEKANLNALVSSTVSKDIPAEKLKTPENSKKIETVSTKAAAKKVDTVTPKTKKTVKSSENNYRNFKSPYINFTFNANDWGYSFGKDMNLSDSIVFPERKPFIIIEFYEKPNYRNHVILYVAEADKMSDFAESKGNEPIDYVKYLFNEYSCKNLNIKETNKDKIVTGNISANNSTKTEKYYIISRHDLLFILISNNQNESQKKLIDTIIDNI